MFDHGKLTGSSVMSVKKGITKGEVKQALFCTAFLGSVAVIVYWFLVVVSNCVNYTGVI